MQDQPISQSAADDSSLEAVVDSIQPLDATAQARARLRLDSLTKPTGSLGRLERVAVQIAGITGSERPRLDQRTIYVLAADHGVTVEGVSAYPQSVTAEMVRNFARGGAAINVLARLVRAEVVVVDVGVAADLPAELPILHRKISFGTANLARMPAMTLGQARAAIEVGISLTGEGTMPGPDVVCLGEMGIGNSTAASAIVAAVTGLPVASVTGRGTGIDDATFERKVAVIERALNLHTPDASKPLEVLRKLGGLEIAGLVGLVLGAAMRRIPIVVDGFIATAAVLIAIELCPAARHYLIAAHRSFEIGHQAALERLELLPLFALDMRLGEGSGAALALPMLDAALALLSEMATFDEAGIAGPTSPVSVVG
jgi:nicotinate-nucleotide--dimethylbenzimidazole phosphoribosyltransferase